MDFHEIEYRERLDSWGMSSLQSHDYYELYFLLEGKRSFFLGETMFNITGPAFCIIPPFSMHKTSGDSYKRVNINVSPRLLTDREREVLSLLAEKTAYSLDGDFGRQVISLLLAASEINLVDIDEKRQATLAFIHTLIYLLSIGNPSPIMHEAKARSEASDTRMLEVAAYINEHYSEDISLDDISERFYISKNSLCARFRDAMSCSVMQYLGFVRLSRAKELLATTTKKMDEISDLCGYSSPNYFSLIFKKSVGISPSEYRKTK